jgi:small-conductance mechanosensitive channel
MEQVDVFLESLQSFWQQFSAFLPTLLAAFILLILGWLVAKALRNISERALKFVKVDVVAERSGIEDFLLRGGVRFTTVTLLSNLIYWFVMFTVLLAVLNVIGIEIASDVFSKIILYIPKVVVAVIVLIFGALFAKFVQGVSFTYLSNVGIAGAQFMSMIAQYAILIFVGSVALEQLEIGGEVLVSAFQIAFGALCLALALAFGLGGKEWAAKVLTNTLKK